MILVVAFSNYRFRRWCSSLNMSDRQPNIRYITRPDQLRGYDWPNVQVVLLSDCYYNKRPGLRSEISYIQALGAEILYRED